MSCWVSAAAAECPENTLASFARASRASSSVSTPRTRARSRFCRWRHVVLAPAYFDPVETGVELDYDADGIARGKALIAALGNLKRETLNHNFAQMESVWDAYRVYAGKA